MKLFRTPIREFLKKKREGDVLTNITAKGERIVFEYGGKHYGNEKENFLEVVFSRAYFERIDAVYKDRYELRVFPNEELRDATEEEVKLLNTKCNEN